jgi:hypothetical protein
VPFVLPARCFEAGNACHASPHRPSLQPNPFHCLQGLAFGFILIRVESLVEEGKI